MTSKLPKAVRDAMAILHALSGADSRVSFADAEIELTRAFYAGAVFGVKEFLGTSGSKTEVLAKIRRMEKEAGK